MTKARPPSPLKPTPPGADKEILDPAHDRLCSWLIENLPQCVEHLWSQTGKWVRATAARAARDGLKEMRETLDVLERWGNADEKAADVREALKRKAAEVRSVLSAFEAPEVSETQGKAQTRSWVAQSEIFVPSSTRGQNKLAGFVDVVADVWQPTGMRLSHFASVEDDHRRSFTESLSFFAAMDGPKHIRDLKPAKMRWDIRGHTFKAAFDVRLELKGKFETITQLKTMRNTTGISTVVLVTYEIPEDWQHAIEEEGFRVLVPSAVVLPDEMGKGSTRKRIAASRKTTFH